MKIQTTLLIACIFLCTVLSAQVGIGTVTPNSVLDVRGSFASSYRSFTVNSSATINDNTLVFTGTVARSLTLPSAVGITGRVYWIKNASSTVPTPVLTIATSGSETVDGNASWILDEPNEIIRVVSDGSNWYVLNQDVAVPKTPTTGGSWLQGGNQVTAAKSVGTVSNFDLPFITNNTEVMRLNTSGYLGLGTNNPASRIHAVNETSDNGDNYIFDDYGTGTTQGMYFTKSRGTVASPLNLQNGDAIGFLRFVPRYNGSISLNAVSSMEAFYKGDGTNNLSDLRFFTSTSERMRIGEDGRVAIGATSWNATNPEQLLVDAGTTTSFNVISAKGTINNYLQLNIQNRSSGTSASSDIVATANNGNESTNYIDMGINSGSYNNNSLPILDGVNTAYLYATGRNFVIGNGSVNRHMLFFTNGFTNADEKVRIEYTGDVGIGTNNPTDKLTVAGVIAPSADNSYTLGKSSARWSAVWAANGTIQTSDIRLKTNIEPLGYGLKEVLLMRPVRYNWINDSGGEVKIGLIAQDVKRIVPEVVSGDETLESLGMNYAELVPVLINAVKEQQQQIDAIRTRVELLEKNRIIERK